MPDDLFSPSPPAPADHAAQPVAPPAGRAINAPEPGQFQPAPLAAAAAASLALAACGGGGSSASAPAAPPPDPPASAAAAARFLQQASFASTPTDMANLQAQGYTAWLDQQLSLPSAQAGYDWLVAQGFNASTNQYNSGQMDAPLWRALIGEGNPVLQRLALFWSEYFVVAQTGLAMAWPQFAAAAYFDLLTTHAVGNFRDLLKAVTLSAAMGEFLSLRGSLKADAAGIRHPDENYAREVMQLFTIGLVQLNLDGTPVLVNGQTVPSYGQADVTGLAAAFTGWDFAGPGTTPDYTRQPMVQVAANHATTAATFLGATVPAGSTGEQALEIILDTLFHHPNLPPFLARQMIQRLVTSNPSPAYVARVASTFVDDGKGVRGNLRAVVMAALLDSEAVTPPSGDPGRVREPMVRFVQWARTFGATSAGAWTIGDTSSAAGRLGQSPLRAASVFNFFAPDYTPPGSTLASQGLVAPELQLLDETTVAGYLNWMQHVIASGAGDVTASYADALPLATDANALVAHINLHLAASQLDAATLSTITTAVAAMPAATSANQLARVHAAVFLAMAAPAYQVLR